MAGWLAGGLMAELTDHELATIHRIHRFWFGDTDTWAREYQHRAKLWFFGGIETDRAIVEQFGDAIELATRGALEHWATHSPRALLCLVLLLDQFTRNAFRGTHRMFEADWRARRIVLELLDASDQDDDEPRKQWFTRDYSPVEQMFLLVVLEHSEELAHVERALTLLQRLADSLRDNKKQRQSFRGVVKSCASHRDTIARFGRYPHRNDVLGRRSTPEEVEYLAQHSTSWMRSVSANATSTTTPLTTSSTTTATSSTPESQT